MPYNIGTYNVVKNEFKNLVVAVGFRERKYIRWCNGVCYCIVWYLSEVNIVKYRGEVLQLNNFASSQLVLD
jgi:hypothetical protein